MTAPAAPSGPGREPDDGQGPHAAGLFFLLIFVMTVPFYLIGLTGWRLPGLPMLPIGALGGVVPMIAAIILVTRSGGGSALGMLLGRLFDPISRAGIAWLSVAVFLMPAVSLIEYTVLSQTDAALPAISFDATYALFLFIAFFVGAIGEELGWQGYAYPMLRRNHTALGAALIIGVFWAAWHILPYVSHPGRLH